MAVLSLTDVVLTIVKPEKKIAHPNIIEPNSLDLHAGEGYIPVFFAYALEKISDTSYVEALHQIKSSLQKVLIPYYPFAGRWVPTLDGRGRQLLCNDQGVPFIEALTDVDLDHVIQDSQPTPALQGYGMVGLEETQYLQDMQSDGLPPIFVQVTSFKSGGVVVAVAFLHGVTDAKGFIDFMKAWSDIARVGQSSVMPIHDRYIGEWTKDAPFVESPSLIPCFLEPCQCSMFQVRKTFVEFIKRNITTETSNGEERRYVSTLDCISAVIWRCLSRLLSTILNKDEVELLTVVEGRSRFFNHSLLEYYSGNVGTLLLFPKIPLLELLERPPFVTASLIRDKIRATSIDMWTSKERVMESMISMGNEKAAAWMISSWRNFPIYEVDFGFGTPLFFSGINSHFGMPICGAIYVGPPIPSTSSYSASVVQFRTNAQILEALQLDSEFNALFFKS